MILVGQLGRPSASYNLAVAIKLDKQFETNLSRYSEMCEHAGWPVRADLLSTSLEEIVRFYQPVRIYIFGSLVRGDFTEHSDLDLLIVVPDDAEKPQRDGLAARRLLDNCDLPKDILVNTASHFERWQMRTSQIQSAVAAEGRVIYAA